MRIDVNRIMKEARNKSVRPSLMMSVPKFPKKVSEKKEKSALKILGIVIYIAVIASVAGLFYAIFSIAYARMERLSNQQPVQKANASQIEIHLQRSN